VRQLSLRAHPAYFQCAGNYTQCAVALMDGQSRMVLPEIAFPQTGKEAPSMSKHLLSLLAGASLMALAGAANAGGVALTDKQMDRVTAGAAGPSQSFEFEKQIDSQSNNQVNFQAKSQVFDVFKKFADINVKSHVTGNSASLGFDNEAVGPNSNVQGTFSQISVAGQGSSQTGLFVSAANGAMARK
jgi:hypothetical protein